MKEQYEAPVLVPLGSVHDLTLSPFNKIGSAADKYTAVTNGQIVGSIVPVR